MDDARFERGRAALDELQGPGTADRMVAALSEISPSFARFAIGASYGELADRGGLGQRERTLLTIAVLATLGGCDAQIERHVHTALGLGIAPREIVETCVQVAVYAGHARANNALRAAAAVLRRRGLLPVEEA